MTGIELWERRRAADHAECTYCGALPGYACVTEGIVRANSRTTRTHVLRVYAYRRLLMRLELRDQLAAKAGTP